MNNGLFIYLIINISVRCTYNYSFTLQYRSSIPKLNKLLLSAVFDHQSCINFPFVTSAPSARNLYSSAYFTSASGGSEIPVFNSHILHLIRSGLKSQIGPPSSVGFKKIPVRCSSVLHSKSQAINITVRCTLASHTHNIFAFILMPNSFWPGMRLSKKLNGSMPPLWLCL